MLTDLSFLEKNTAFPPVQRNRDLTNTVKMIAYFIPEYRLNGKKISVRLQGDWEKASRKLIQFLTISS